MPSSPPRRGAYGFDAPYAPALMTLGGAGLLSLSILRLWPSEEAAPLHGAHLVAAFAPAVAALWMFLHAGVFVYTTRVGKFAVWSNLLDGLKLQGDERLLDIGCGRGAVLLMA